jgi:hypothetical protein
MALEAPENVEPVEAVDTQRESSGHAPMAGVGDVDGEGDSRRKEGCSWSSWPVAIFGVPRLYYDAGDLPAYINF